MSTDRVPRESTWTPRALGPGHRDDQAVSAWMVALGPRRRDRAGGDPRAAGHGLCRVGRPAGGERPLHHDGVLGRLCAVRPVEDSRARARLVARPVDPPRNSSPRDHRRPRRVGRSRRDAGAARRRDRDRAGAREARLRRRPALEGGPGRLHDRPGHHDHHGPAPEAVRLLHRCRQVPRRGAGILRRPRRAQPLHVGGRSGLACPAC